MAAPLDLAAPPATLNRPDLDSVDQIAEMVRRFYRDVNTDELLGPIFNDVAQVDWDVHIPKLTAFWARVLLDLDGYHGNPFGRHAAVHTVSPLRPAHFERWLKLFDATLNDGWSGPATERARAMAHNVARVHTTQLGVTGV
ncbi:MAG: group III truncated hemoglobin [Acidimicrobiales bacterium]